MPQVSANLAVTTAQGSYDFNFNKQYNVLYTNDVSIPRGTSFTDILDVTGTRGKLNLREGRFICLQNKSNQTIELMITYPTGTAGDPNTTSGTDFTTQILPPNQYILIPSNIISHTASSTSLAIGDSLDNVVPDSNIYIDSTADVDSATADGIVNSTTATRLYLEPYTSATNCTANLFRVGDLVRIRDEVMEITAIGDKSDLANNYVDVIRGVSGSTAVTAGADDDPVRFPFFNQYHKFDKYTVAQTDEFGKFKASNFFGYGRTLLTEDVGFVRGSIAIKFYEPAYQNFGIGNLTPNSKTGITPSTTIKFGLKLNGKQYTGSGTGDTLTITTSATNQTFGSGAGNLIEKIQTQINNLYSDKSKNNFEQGAIIGIVDGDLRITSTNRTTSSEVQIIDVNDSDPWELGRFDIIASDTAPSTALQVAAKLPNDTIFKNNIEDPNLDAFLMDDGKGNLIGGGGAWSGSIDYDSGAIDFTAVPNAEFVLSGYYESILGGGNTTGNRLAKISARSTSTKRDAKVYVVALD